MQKNKTIVYIQYTNPAAYPPLEHSSLIFANDGWKVQLLGANNLGVENLTFPVHTNITCRLLPLANAGWKQRLRYVTFVIWTLWNVCTSRPNVIYASDMWSYPIALIATLFFRIPVVMHEHDTPRKTGSALNLAFGSARHLLAKRAFLCIIPQTERAKNFQNTLHPKKCLVVWNCSLRNDVPLNSMQSKDQERFILWYHGSIVPTQFPITIVDTIAMLPANICVRFAGYETSGHKNYIQSLYNRATELGVRDRIEYLGTIDTRDQLLKEGSRCHVGLCLFQNNFREPMVGASNKPFDYLSCGMTLLVNQSEEWKDFFVNPGYARSVNPEDKSSVADNIRWLYEHSDDRMLMAKSGKDRILNDWNYDEQFWPVLNLVNSIE